jgi:hypothetical protein
MWSRKTEIKTIFHRKGAKEAKEEWVPKTLGESAVKN